MRSSGNEKLKPNVQDLLLDALETRWKNYRSELKRCQSEFSNDAVHDLRVATRRILALIKLLNTVFPHPRLKKMKGILKDQLDQFDNLRDTQVMLIEISRSVQDFPQLEEFQKFLQDREAKWMHTLHKKIKKFDPSKLAKGIRKTHESVETNVSDDMELQIMGTVDAAFERTRQRLSHVDLARPETIHHVRIAFKSFRYMVETIHPLLKDFPETYLKQMNTYQSLMGEIQDVEVWIQTFTEFAASASSPDLEPIRHSYEQRHAEAISAYNEGRHQLHAFWRPAPDRPFPWEKSA